MTCTIFKDIYSLSEPSYIPVEKALERIKSGRSQLRVEMIRNAETKEQANEQKKFLPSVCFSGKFTKRQDDALLEHSGFIVLDFDNVSEIDVKAAEFASKAIVYAFWISPSGNGLKVLIRIADGKKHREHFNALKEVFPDADNSGVNESRVCYESYDPNLYLNPDAEIFTRTLTTEKIQAREVVSDEQAIFKKLVKWITNKRMSFVKGERNTFIFKLAGACCRYGISQDSAEWLITAEYPTSNDFTQKEANNTVKSAYKKNASVFGSAVFDREILIDKQTRKEVEIPKEIDMDAPPQDVIYGHSVKNNALKIFREGYTSVKGIGVPKIDELFKHKRGEVTCLTGIGNHGKSTFEKWMNLMRVLLYGEKFASFSPEDNPPEEYYHDYVEMLLGRNCTPWDGKGLKNFRKPSEDEYSNAYDFVSKHIFYLYPENAAPTPVYIRERFLELIMKEKVAGVAIDPWNQLAHDYGGKKDEYLEAVFLDFSRFTQQNSVYMKLIAHPNKMQKEKDGNYPCPDVYDLAGGGMWVNKMDNILVYHRPFKNSAPENPACEFHAKKIKRQKIVGRPGFTTIEYSRRSRRFEIDGHDPMCEVLRKNDLSFYKPVENYVPKPIEPDKEIPHSNPYAGFQPKSDPLPDGYFNDTH